MFVGIGKSTSRDAREAGREAAGRALAVRGSAPVDLVLAFASAAHDQGQVLRGITELTGSAPLSGCSTSGVITGEGSDESTHVVAVLALASPDLTCETFHVRGLSKNPTACSDELVRAIAASRVEGRLLLVFPDGITGDLGELLGELDRVLPYPVAIAGGTAADQLLMRRTWQYHGDQAEYDGLSAVLLGGRFVADVAVSHGCVPIGTEQTVTRAEHGWIHEIDGQPAWEVYREYLDPQDRDELTMSHFCYLCIAERLPEPDPVYGPYIIRCPLQLDKATGAMLFPGGIVTGTRVQLALRSPEKTVAAADASTRALFARHPDRRPAIVLQFDCCCRASLLFGRHTTERIIGPLQQLAADVPWFGFNTYGEIAQIVPGSAVRFHNYTTVICALYEDGAP